MDQEKPGLGIFYWSTTDTQPCSLPGLLPQFVAAGALFQESFCWSASPSIHLQPEQMHIMLQQAPPWRLQWGLALTSFWETQNGSHTLNFTRLDSVVPVFKPSYLLFCVHEQEGLHEIRVETASFVERLPLGDWRVLWFICHSSSAWQHTLARSLRCAAPLIPLMFHTKVG